MKEQLQADSNCCSMDKIENSVLWYVLREWLDIGTVTKFDCAVTSQRWRTKYLQAIANRFFHFPTSNCLVANAWNWLLSREVWTNICILNHKTCGFVKVGRVPSTVIRINKAGVTDSVDNSINQIMELSSNIKSMQARNGSVNWKMSCPELNSVEFSGSCQFGQAMLQSLQNSVSIVKLQGYSNEGILPGIVALGSVCKNLTELHVNSHGCENAIIETVFSHCNQLRIAHVYSTAGELEINKKSFAVLVEAKTLEELVLFNVSLFAPRTAFYQLCSALTALRFLDISTHKGTEEVDALVMEKILRNCTGHLKYFALDSKQFCLDPALWLKAQRLCARKDTHSDRCDDFQRLVPGSHELETCHAQVMLRCDNLTDLLAGKSYPGFRLSDITSLHVELAGNSALDSIVSNCVQLVDLHVNYCMNLTGIDALFRYFNLDRLETELSLADEQFVADMLSAVQEMASEANQYDYLSYVLYLSNEHLLRRQQRSNTAVEGAAGGSGSSSGQRDVRVRTLELSVSYHLNTIGEQAWTLDVMLGGLQGIWNFGIRVPYFNTFMCCVIERFGSTLQHLDFTKCSIDHSVTSAMAAHCRSLSTLVIRDKTMPSDRGVLEVIRRCTKLRRLHLTHKAVSEQVLLAISKHSSRLQSLIIEMCSKVTVPALEHTVRRCQELEYVYVKNCPHVAKEEVLDLLFDYGIDSNFEDFTE